MGAALFFTCGVCWCWPKGAPDRLVVSVLSVGAGSAMVVELPDGRTVLCDAGSSSPYDVGRNTVVPFLRHQGVTRIDRVYVSHPNLDHFSGIPSIVDEVETGPIVVNEYFHRRSGPTSPSRHLLDRLAELDHPVHIMDASKRRWELGGVTFERLWPPGDLSEGLATNETSTVLRLTYAGHSILFTGDIEDHAQRSLVEQGNLAADVLILPHHGGVEPSTHAFIDAVGASTLIRSSHEPRVETFNGLYEMAGATPVYNTADVGAVQVVIDREGVHVSSMRGMRRANSR
jgi:competence protein ComEC